MLRIWVLLLLGLTAHDYRLTAIVCSRPRCLFKRQEELFVIQKESKLNDSSVLKELRLRNNSHKAHLLKDKDQDNGSKRC